MRAAVAEIWPWNQRHMYPEYLNIAYIGNMSYVSRVVESSKYYQCYKCRFKVINMLNEIGVAG